MSAGGHNHYVRRRLGKPESVSIVALCCGHKIMAGLARILESLGVKCHLYADDTQFVVTFDKGDEMLARSKIVEIYAAIKAFMFQNCLKLNTRYIKNRIHTVLPLPN